MCLPPASNVSKCPGLWLLKTGYVYSLGFTDDQVLLAQDHDDMEYMVRKLKEGYEKRGFAIYLEKTKYVCMEEGKEILRFEGVGGRNKVMFRMYLFG